MLSQLAETIIYRTLRGQIDVSILSHHCSIKNIPMSLRDDDMRKVAKLQKRTESMRLTTLRLINFAAGR